jgi:hypothetical protein
MDNETPDRTGRLIRFKVEDNGEGNNANSDRMTLMNLSPTLPDCNTPIPLALNPIEGGNIQVK